jgi:heme A synthase
MLPVSITTGDDIKSSDWIGFSGRVLSGVITLLAAILAWFAVQRQIKSRLNAQERAAERVAERERERECASKVVREEP